MTIMAAFDRWLTAPESNAVGRLCLFRILFALNYLWIIHGFSYTQMTQVPLDEWQPVALLGWLTALPDATFFHGLHVLLIGGLFLLLIGFRTRLATLLVLAAGLILDMFTHSFGKVGHGLALMVFYIPLFMLFADWGAAYSVDALLMRCRVDVRDSSWRYGYPIKLMLILLSLLFFTAAVHKLMGSWGNNPAVIINSMSVNNVRAVMAGEWAQPLVPFIAETPGMGDLLRFLGIAFQALFVFSLFNRRLRNVFIAGAILFHTFIFWFMRVGFDAQIIAYALFVDWQRLYDWLLAPLFRRVRLALPRPALVAGAVVIVAGGVLLWFGTSVFQTALGWFNPDLLLWVIIAPFSLFWMIWSAVGFLRDVRSALLRSDQAVDLRDQVG
jgi:hypothetical protein